jgi:hypothetical protein
MAAFARQNFPNDWRVFFLRLALIHAIHMAFKISNLYNFITELCRQQKGLANNSGRYIRDTGQDDAQSYKYNRRKLGSVEVKVAFT